MFGPIFERRYFSNHWQAISVTTGSASGIFLMFSGMKTSSTAQSGIENGRQWFAGIICGQRLDDEVTMVDALLVRGLGCGHEMGMDLGSPFRSGATDHLSHHYQSTRREFSIVIVSRKLGVAHEMQKAMEFLMHSRLKPGHVGVATERGIGNQSAETNANPSLFRFIAGGLRDERVEVNLVEAVCEFSNPLIRRHLQGLVCIPQEMHPAELVDHPFTGPRP
jgi:hypothetical protein